MINQVDVIIRDSLGDFVSEVTRSLWKGREREAISLYAFGFLQRYITADGVLRDTTQIGIEVTVPSDKAVNPKGRVAKDLVLWAEPKMTCWDQNWRVTNFPLAIMEWKVYRLPSRKAVVSNKDTEWLLYYSKYCPSAFVGYAISLDLIDQEFRINVTRGEGGSVQERRLVL